MQHNIPNIINIIIINANELLSKFNNELLFDTLFDFVESISFVVSSVVVDNPTVVVNAIN